MTQVLGVELPSRRPRAAQSFGTSQSTWSYGAKFKQSKLTSALMVVSLLSMRKVPLVRRIKKKIVTVCVCVCVCVVCVCVYVCV